MAVRAKITQRFRTLLEACPIRLVRTGLMAMSAVSLGGCMGATLDYRDDKVEVVDKIVVNYLNPHSSWIWKDLTVIGQRFTDVGGLQPFYLVIPDKNSILFVTGPSSGGKAVVHIVNLSTQQEFHFPAYDSTIRRSIGSSEKSDLMVKGDVLVITLTQPRFHAKYSIDLERQVFLREEGDVLPRYINETEWRHYVLEGGKDPKSK